MKASILSHFIHENTPLYGGHKTVKIAPQKSILKKDSSNVLKISFNTHTSTHVDLPYHFLPKGKNLNHYPPHSWLFQKIFTQYLALSPSSTIHEKHFKDIQPHKDTDCLLIKTDFEKYRDHNIYIKESPIVMSTLASFLKRRLPSLKMIGFDFISLSALRNRPEGRKSHKLFLKNDIMIVEDMKLSELMEKPDLLLVSPLLVDKADGAPTTVWAFYNEFQIQNYDYIFFDLDGVLLDSVDIKTQAFKKMYEKYGSHIAKKVVAHHKTNGGMSRFEKFKLYHKEYLGVHISEKQVKTLATNFSNLVFKEVLKAKFINGALDFLKLCKETRKTIFLVSATPEDELKKTVKFKKINHYFKEARGSPQDKAINVYNLIRKYRVDPHKSVFFGDSTNDLKAATYNNIKFIGMSDMNSEVHYKNFNQLLN